MNRIWTKEEIKNFIANRDDAVIRGMNRIYDYQTESEQCDGYTHELNGVGYSGADAEIMSSFVTFYSERGYLSRKQMAIARKKMLKYVGQLTRIVNNKQ